MSQRGTMSWVGHQSMRRFYPDWASADITDTPVSQAVDFLADYNEYTEFFLSCNWILRPAGLKEFYRRIRQKFRNPEIIYEVEHGCFRIRCKHEAQHDIVIACNTIMDDIVEDEIKLDTEEEQLICIGTGTKDMVYHISEWRSSKPTKEELVRYETFSYPYDIIEFPYKTTWRIPRRNAKDGLDIRKLFLSHDPVKLMSETTRCMVIRGTDNTSLHFGADCEEDIALAKRKLEIIMKYYDLNGQIGMQKTVIFAEDNSTGLAELRYLAQTDRKYLRNIVLDPTRFMLAKDYQKLFEKGSFVRSLRRQEGELVPAAAVLRPAIPMNQGMSSFEPFKAGTFEVGSKEPEWNILTRSVGDIQTLPVLNEDHLNQVNPQAAPGVFEWTTAIPPYEAGSVSSIKDAPISETTTNPLSRTAPSKLDLHRSFSVSSGSMAVHDLPMASFVDDGNAGRNPSYSGADELRNDRGASIYRNQNSVASSPQTTNASSEVPRRQGHIAAYRRRHDSPSPIRRLDFLAQENKCDTNTQSTDSINHGERMNNLKKKIEMLQQDIPPSGNPFVNAQNPHHSVLQSSQKVFDEDLFGALFSPQATQGDDTQYEPLDLLSTSPRETIDDDALIPPPLTDHNPKPHLFYKPMNQEVPCAQQNIVRTEAQEPDSITRNKIFGHLTQMLEPLRMYQGHVNLKADIGRFWFTKVNWQHISIPGMQGRSRAKTVEAWEGALDKHCASRDLYFNNILTIFGGDANFLGSIPSVDDPSAKMWLPGFRHTFFEFWCVTKSETGKKTYFVLQVNASTWEYRLRLADTKESNVYIHCAKRDFDFRVVLEAASDIEKTCRQFAEEVVSSMKVTPQIGLEAPLLEFVNFNDWGIETKSVRYRQVATYNNSENTCKLHVSHVHCMKKKVTKMSPKCFWHFTARPEAGKPADGYFGAWFEAYITSNKAEEALVQNSSLGFAEEADWTPESLKESGAIDDLLKSAANTVKHMDGIGYWINNQQDNMQFGVPPHTSKELIEQATACEVISYW